MKPAYDPGKPAASYINKINYTIENIEFSFALERVTILRRSCFFTTLYLNTSGKRRRSSPYWESNAILIARVSPSIGIRQTRFQESIGARYVFCDFLHRRKLLQVRFQSWTWGRIRNV